MDDKGVAFQVSIADLFAQGLLKDDGEDTIDLTDKGVEKGRQLLLSLPGTERLLLILWFLGGNEL